MDATSAPRTPCRRGEVPRIAAGAFGLLAMFVASLATSAEPPLRVFATTPDLGALAREVGGDRVAVVEMVRGREDPHFAEARPSFIRELAQADLLLRVGLGLEAGYLPRVVEQSRNARVQPGSPGYLDASQAVQALGVPTVAVDRSMGDVHPEGSPHYLLDPVRGLAVAGRIEERLSALRPADEGYFEGRLAAFRARLGAALAGETLAGRYDPFKLAVLAERGALGAFLEARGERESLGGWLGQMLPLAGTRVVDDHGMWTYFAARFGLEVVGHLEPRPGIPPTTAHLQALVAQMKRDGVRAVLASPYYDPRHARFVAEATGAVVLELAHQCGGREGTGDYVSMVGYNVATVADALEKAG